MCADNFEKTCAAQAMTLKVLMATDFFHGPPFQIKREFQEKKEIVRGLWDLKKCSSAAKTEEPWAWQSLWELQVMIGWRTRTGSLGNTAPMDYKQQLQLRSILWMDSLKLGCGILGTMDSDSREIKIKSHALKRSSQLCQNKMNIWHTLVLYVLHEFL